MAIKSCRLTFTDTTHSVSGPRRNQPFNSAQFYFRQKPASGDPLRNCGEDLSSSILHQGDVMYPESRGSPQPASSQLSEKDSVANLSRFDFFRAFVFSVLLILPAASEAQQVPPLAEAMSKTYGLDSFRQVDGIRYTFNLDLPSLNLVRSDKWEWDPKTNAVSFEGKDRDGKPIKVTYQRSQLASQSDLIKQVVDPAFINDQYWLIFPFHVVWDGAAVTDEGRHKLPIGMGSAELLRVKYGSAHGYTPGDTWDLYVGPDKRVKEMFYHRGGPKKPSEVILTWAGYKQAGPLLFSTEHRGTADDKPVHITFTGVAVKAAGSDKWMSAQ
jgi:hypothetical protein